jgi:hypothetical protein
MIGGVQKHLTAAVVVDGKPYTPAEIVTVLQDPITKADATAAAKGVWQQAVAADKASIAASDPVYRGVKREVLNLYKGQPSVLADFGLTEPTRKKTTTAEKAAAVVKREKTVAAKKPAAAGEQPGQQPPPPVAAPAGTTKQS